MKRLVRILLFFSFGYLLGKNHSERIHAKDAAKIVDADYLDDQSKVRLLKDLHNKKGDAQHLATEKQSEMTRRSLLKKKLLSVVKKAQRLSKPILKLKK